MKFSSISVITAGPALGHGCFIDAITLQQVLTLGNENAPIKVFPDHNETVTDLIGAMSNFRFEGDQVKADLDLIEENPLSGYYAKILDIFPDQLGFSIAWTGGLEEIDGQQYARISDLTSVDLVSQPAANEGGVYSAKIASRRLKAVKSKAAKKPATTGQTPEEVAESALPQPVEDLPADVAETMPDVMEPQGGKVDSNPLDTMSTSDSNPTPVTAEEALSAALAKALEPITATLAALNDKLDVLAKAEADEVQGDEAAPMDEDEGMAAGRPDNSEKDKAIAELQAKLSVLEASNGSEPVAGAAFQQTPADLAAAYASLSGKEAFAFAKKHFNTLRSVLPKNS